jgi:hypothetical protein
MQGIMPGMGDHLSLATEAGEVTIARDDYGVPHVRARSTAGAWFGMGYACAQDRLFQLDYDRRRACGRWAEVAGPDAVAGDILARRMSLAAAAQRDVAAMSAPLRAAFEAYARGVRVLPARPRRGTVPAGARRRDVGVGRLGNPRAHGHHGPAVAGQRHLEAPRRAASPGRRAPG